MNTTNDYTVNAVQKALRILKLFAGDDELSLQQISEKTGIGKSSALRLIYTLHNEGFVAFNEKNKHYSLGLKVFELGIKKFESTDIRKLALPRLQKMADETGLICYLAIRSQDVLAMLEKVFPASVPMWAQLMAQSGGTVPLYSTGIGRLFLAHMPDDELRNYFGTVELKRLTPDTITDVDKLMELVEKARKEGVSCNHGENEPYISAICAPIYNHTGAMTAGISICGMKDIIFGKERKKYREMLLDSAHYISEQLGFRKC